jgi:hypothetical protein
VRLFALRCLFVWCFDCARCLLAWLVWLRFKQTNKQTNKRTNKQTNKQANKQTNQRVDHWGLTKQRG